MKKFVSLYLKIRLMERVYVTQDDSGHWYVIPYSLKDQFNALLDADEEDYDAQDEFILKFSQYMTGGDLNNKELYAELG